MLQYPISTFQYFFFFFLIIYLKIVRKICAALVQYLYHGQSELLIV